MLCKLPSLSWRLVLIVWQNQFLPVLIYEHVVCSARNEVLWYLVHVRYGVAINRRNNFDTVLQHCFLIISVACVSNSSNIVNNEVNFLFFWWPSARQQGHPDRLIENLKQQPNYVCSWRLIHLLPNIIHRPVKSVEVERAADHINITVFQFLKWISQVWNAMLTLLVISSGDEWQATMREVWTCKFLSQL